MPPFYSTLKSSRLSRASRAVIMSTGDVSNGLNVAESRLASTLKEWSSVNKYESDVTSSAKTDSYFTGNSRAKLNVPFFKSKELTSSGRVHITGGNEYYEEVTAVFVESSTREASTDVLGFESESVNSHSYSDWLHSTLSFLSSTTTISVPIRLESSVTLWWKDRLSSSDTSYTSDTIDTTYLNEESEVPSELTSTVHSHTFIQPRFRG
jgi:hypothetical protein